MEGAWEDTIFSKRGERTVFCGFWIQPELGQAELIKRLLSWKNCVARRNLTLSFIEVHLHLKNSDGAQLM